jgi:hypothetical protein
MEMPRPTDAHRRLEQLAGTWIGTETMHPSPWDPKGGTATGRIEARMDLGGFFLIEDYVQERGGQVTYRGHGVFGHDAGSGAYTMHWFDCMGGSGEPARGTWDGDTLTLQSQTPMGHGRYTYRVAPGEIGFKLEQSRDGREWSTYFDATYRRA